MLTWFLTMSTMQLGENQSGSAYKQKDGVSGDADLGVKREKTCLCLPVPAVSAIMPKIQSPNLSLGSSVGVGREA
jgi:hypothetical protein